MEFLIILALTSQELVILLCLEKVKYLVVLILSCLEAKNPISADSANVQGQDASEWDVDDGC